MTDVTMRAATRNDSDALFRLIDSHRDEGRLLPRSLDDLRAHAARFVVCEVGGVIKACAELAPLSPTVAEVRSLVVGRDFRRVGLAARLVGDLRARACAEGVETLVAFSHDARFFVRQNFSIVPHLWVPEKIASTCRECPLFRRCAQFALVLDLEARQLAAPMYEPAAVA